MHSEPSRIEYSNVENQKNIKFTHLSFFSHYNVKKFWNKTCNHVFYPSAQDLTDTNPDCTSCTVYCFQNSEQVRTYQLICPNSSCSCRRSSARSVSMLEELEEPEEEGEEEREWRWSWPLHRAMLWDFIRDSTRCTFAPTEWLAVSDWGREITVSEMGNI